ncbi:LiaI-LiaF-like domain-containing protein [Olivibacter sp. XZL3]|uniref:LiaF transmembrane domain-containing protein n=1 Tax=Olivibacter sp. XZL3 TaxID=1735116 RepID=UPI0010671942|nr:DUF5668 domain-containing protein [Olivibacter sp. XZL3]
MDRERLNWGLVLLFIGVMWLLSNTGVISFYWSSLWRFWPVFLIILGVNLLLPKHGIGNLISVIATIAILIFIGFQVSKPSTAWGERAHFRGRADVDETGDDGEVKEADFSSPYNAGIRRARLEIKGGAVEYKMEGTATDLFKAHSRGVFAGHALQTTTKDSVAELFFNMKDVKKKNWNIDGDENKVDMSLNTNPLWTIRVDVGAGAVDFDLSQYKVERLTLKGGAASFETKLGMPVGESVIEAESGVASIEIEIPKEAAARIDVKSGLSSKEFSGFVKQNDGTYITDGFEQARHKYLIDLKGGLSSFSVKRY